MTAIRQKLDECIRPVVTGLDYTLLSIKYLPQGKHSLLRVYIDQDKGITIDDCAKVSHQLSGVLDVEEPLSGQYQLEVSSPGLDRPLFNLQDFVVYAGKEVHIKLAEPIGKQRKVTGIIESVVGSTIKIKQPEATLEIEFENIKDANLVPKF